MVRIYGTPNTAAAGRVFTISVDRYPTICRHSNCWAVKSLYRRKTYSGICFGYYPTRSEALEACGMIAEAIAEGFTEVHLPASRIGNEWEHKQ